MNYRRVVIGFTVLISLYMFFWWVGNSTYIRMDDPKILLYMNGSSQMGYSSLLAYGTYYCLIYLAFLNFSISTESVIVLTRTNRKKFIHKYIGYIFIISLLFALVITIVNVVMTTLFLGYKYLIQERFYIACMFSWVSLFFFYSIVGLVMKAMSDLTKSNLIGLVSSFFIVSIFYFVGRSFHNVWTPVKDLIMFEGVLSNVLSNLMIAIIYLKQLIIAIGLCIIVRIIFNEKDMLPNEN